MEYSCPSLTSLKRSMLLMGVLPLLVLAVVEVYSVTESESEIEQLVLQQVEHVLFSINQQSWELVSEWFGKEDIARVGFPASVVSVRDFRPDEVLERYPQLSSIQLDEMKALWESAYRKVEVVPNTEKKEQSLFVAWADVKTEQRVRVMEVHTQSFIQQHLYPQLERAAGAGFTLEIYHRDEPSRAVVSTGSESYGRVYVKPLWILPEYELRLSSTFFALEQQLAKRKWRSLVLLIIVFSLLGGGLWMVYRAVRRETELARLKTDFVANVSHELRTPLALIRMFAESLEMGRVRSDEKRQEYLRIIRAETERLTHLINNILHFSKMEAGTKRYACVPTQLNDIVQNMVDSYAFKLEQEGFALTLELDAQLPLVSVDQDAIQEAVLNVLDNAMKYSKERKEIRIRTGVLDKEVFIQVQDRGIGIAKEHQQKIFEKFYRVSGTLVHETKGTGLGLNLVWHAVAAHQGRISVESTPGLGSTFTITLPITSS